MGGAVCIVASFSSGPSYFEPARTVDKWDAGQNAHWTKRLSRKNQKKKKKKKRKEKKEEEEINEKISHLKGRGGQKFTGTET